jgi:hypothetical protein
MRPAEPAQLKQMLDRAQEPVCLRQASRILAADIPAGRQRRECGERRCLAQLLIGPAVHKLEQLNGELDVP